MAESSHCNDVCAWGRGGGGGGRGKCFMRKRSYKPNPMKSHLTKFFLSAIYLFLLEMYYQPYVIFEALHVICKQLKIIYYPKLYRSTHVCVFISSVKDGVVLTH